MTPNDYRIQGIEVMREKTIQAMDLARLQMHPDDFAYAEACCLGMIDGCNQVIKEIREDDLPEKFSKIFID